MSRFLDALNSGRVLLMDGAMGTELQRAGMREDECYELWNLTHPDRVRAIHQAYLDAGAACLVTNTFQANAETLSAKGVSDTDQRRILSQGVELARSVGNGTHFVLASIGPPRDLWRRGKIPDRTRLDALAGDCLRQMECLSSADGVLLETQPCAGLVATVLRKDSSVTRSKPLLISFSFASEDGSLRDDPNQALPDAMGGYADDEREHFGALGVNCGRNIGMDEIIDIVRQYRRYTSLPLFARPNAGTPERVGNAYSYPHTPEMMAARLPELLEAGVRMVGGCCGTTPAHIAAFRAVIDEWNAGSPLARG
jgi:methionine synthase I (cobalamin-dependent)